MLALRDTHAEHKSEELEILLNGVLDEFDKSQILCIISDNASNMIKLIERMNDCDDCESNSVEIDPDHETQSIDNITENASSLDIQHMRCAAHSLQLAIRDGLKKKRISKILSKLRQIATAARSSKIDEILKRRAGKGATLDQATRWGSTYLMIKRLIELKTYLNDLDNEELSLSNKYWEQTVNLEKVLECAFVTTKKFQCENLTPGDFFCEWRELIFKLQKFECDIADDIIASMTRREVDIMVNTILLAGIYVNPLNRVLLNDNQTQLARQALYELMVKMKGKNANNDRQLSDVSQESVVIDEFDKYLDSLEKNDEKIHKIGTNDIQKEKLFNDLNKIEQFNRKDKRSFNGVVPYYPENIAMLHWLQRQCHLLR